MERSQSCATFEATHLPGGSTCHVLPHMRLSQHDQRLPHAGSTENLATSHFPPSKPLRRKKLLRQQLAVDNDDLAYAADLEEEGEVEDVVMPSRLQSLHQKQLQYQQNKPHSENTLMRHISCSSSSSNSSTTTTINSSTSSCSSGYTSSGPPKRPLKHEESFDSTKSAGELSPLLTQRHLFCSSLFRDNSLHSDSSRYSSVDSLLESRKPDPEAILINLGFGPIGTEDILARIPKRFLKPSQVRGIDTEAFVKRLQLASSLADHSVLGYRGLTGNPDMPPSSIVAKIMERFEVNQRKKSMGSIEHAI